MSPTATSISYGSRDVTELLGCMELGVPEFKRGRGGSGILQGDLLLLPILRCPCSSNDFSKSTPPEYFFKDIFPFFLE